MSEETRIPDTFRAYEEGKHRRYNLLFAVNGGAFAIAKLLAAPETITSPVLVNLELWHLSLGMALFTLVMVVDIFMFGENMRNRMEDLFTWQGKLVLTLIGLLIAAGWALASFGVCELSLVILVYLGTIGTVWAVLERQHSTKAQRESPQSS